MAVKTATRPRSVGKADAQSEMRQRSKVAKWLCCASGKGGNGKTSTSLNLAVYGVHDGLKVCLVDLDSQRTLSRWRERRPAEAPEFELWSGLFTEIQRAITEIEARDDIDLVVVDTPPGIDIFPENVQAMLSKADLVLIPTTQGTADLDSVIEWMQFLKREQVNAAFLINRAQRTFGTYRRARNRLVKAGNLCPVDIRQLEDVQKTHDLGVGVLEMSRSAAAEDYQGLWDFVRNQLRID